MNKCAFTGLKIKAFVLPVTLVFGVVCGCGGHASADRGLVAAHDSVAAVDSDEATIDEALDTVPAGARALLEAYPDFIKGYADNQLALADGSTLTYDDGREKDFVTMLDQSDPEDMFSMTYSRSTPPDYLSDAGRSRCEALFKAMYGSSADAVQSKLVKVDWFGQRVDFTAVNGAADSLRAVVAELKNHPELKPYLKSSGSFYWRKVRGATRQSAHSYGIAFDIAVDKSDYWRWKNPSAAETDRIAYHNRIPSALVDIFERHDFIWGGAWYHFDTMHFEFRPEILRFASRR